MRLVEHPRASSPAALSPRACITTLFALPAALLVPSVAAAQPHPSPSDETSDADHTHAALDRARTAWEKGDYDVAEPLYSEAIEKGGLSPGEVLEAYVHLGAARAVLGKKPGALAAFRAAALIDLDFTVPADVGKRATTIADLARHQLSKAGPLTLHMAVPEHVAPHTSVRVDVTLDPAHAAAGEGAIGVTARDASGGSSHTESFRTAESGHFDLPAALSLPSTTLRVRVDWLDVHANRLASVEQQVHVQPQTTNLPGALAGAGAAKDDGAHRGFWHTAWPYIIGSAALAAGGAAVYFATRSGDDVNVTGVRVVTH